MSVFVLVADAAYWPKARRTILDLRTVGQWTGDIVLITVDFDMNRTFGEFYRVDEKKFAPIQEKHELTKLLHYSNFTDTIDGRELSKLNQWEKLHVFDDFFRKWDRVIFLDAGLRVLDTVDRLLSLDCTGRFLAPHDGGNYVAWPNPHKLFRTQLSLTFQKRVEEVTREFGEVLDESYFLNCMWMYDTKILDVCSKQDMIAGIVKYPVCKTNEMTLMNLFLHFKHGLWSPFPVRVDGKILFDWCELNNPNPSSWKEYCFIKYPCSISFEDC